MYRSGHAVILQTVCVLGLQLDCASCESRDGLPYSIWCSQCKEGEGVEGREESKKEGKERGRLWIIQDRLGK